MQVSRRSGVARPTSSRMNSDHVVLDPGRRGHSGNREDLCGFGGAEGDRTPDLMSAIQMPVLRPFQAKFHALAEIRKSDPPRFRGFMRPRNTGAKDDQNLCPEELTMFKSELV